MKAIYFMSLMILLPFGIRAMQEESLEPVTFKLANRRNTIRTVYVKQGTSLFDAITQLKQELGIATQVKWNAIGSSNSAFKEEGSARYIQIIAGGGIQINTEIFGIAGKPPILIFIL